MNATTPGWRDRLMALTLLAACLVALWWLMAMPYLAQREASSQRLLGLQTQLVQFEQLRQESRLRAEQRESAFDDPALAAQLLPPQRPPVAAASLQQALRERVNAAGAQLVSIQSLAAQSDEGLVPIRLRVTLRGDSPALRDLLHGLEAATPLLIVEELLVRRLAPGRVGRVGQATEQLDIRLQVAGFLREDTP
ncbi:type II secretion system protein GspM [Halomonas urumqiensis]|uniref:General secretion pathway protein GspM n=1 Tax=Halomonas urumqiensis TaxID=1684789 RepID=A0A2N7UP93_9GAMM|nr:type II secretion system protein GspM [Halomonas urumqiensis]PMR82254.1 hypothetical protein C1H70_03460 [Halomonas urumqiensis]PTB02968.1 hypothetical protein C6V82_00055 [Halomonas urumqiensis]GHE20915.1 hypothetical protein GCM10017767_14360 [Halomonas urumqiensis]